MTAVINISLFKEKALTYANAFNVCCYLDSNNYTDKYGNYDCLIAIGASKEIKADAGSAFEQLTTFTEREKSWLFGMFSYDLKNEVELLETPKPDSLGFPDLYFFIPQTLIAVKNNSIEVIIGNKGIIQQIEATPLPGSNLTEHLPVNIKAKIDKATYLSKINQLQKHIVNGDIYEVNFCQEFFAEHAQIDPLATYKALCKLSPTPFSGYLKINEKFILSATPERFLTKQNNKLISQPIKGTAKRGINTTEDDALKIGLRNSQKEQAENVMIVDLVRNDLTKSAIKGSVKVDELFGIYTFPQVHQMISTISCTLASDVHYTTAIKNAFPMGSMTGAPKLRAMQLIDRYEESKRGAYSGAMGYFTPNGNLDFNVIIRSILYNAKSKYVSFQVGGAITFNSDPEKEYEECMLKASAMMQIFNK